MYDSYMCSDDCELFYVKQSKPIFAPGVKRKFFDFYHGIQHIFDKIIVMGTCRCIFYTRLVKM